MASQKGSLDPIHTDHKVESEDKKPPPSDHIRLPGSIDQPINRLPIADSHMTEKAFTLASLNVRGLRGSMTKPKEIKVWLASLPTPPQIVLIQEHHLGKEDTPDAAKGIEF